MNNGLLFSWRKGFKEKKMRLIFLLIVAYLAYRLVKDYILPPQSPTTGGAHSSGGGGGAAPSEGAEGAGGEEEEMALDPVCGSYIPASSALRVRKDSEVVHFCGEECRQKFMASLKE